MPASSVLLLDVMSTLVHDPFFDEVMAFLGTTPEELRAGKDHEAWLAFERGAIDEEDYLRRFWTDGRGVDRPGLRRCLADAYRWLDGIETLLGELAAREVPMYALSNYSEWYRIIEDKLQLSRFVDWRFVSCRTGVRKPDREAYLGAARALGVSPSRCLFVDDKERNCAAAREAGMAALLFRDAAALRDDLSRRGLLG